MKIFLASEFRGTIYNGELYLAPKAYAIYKRYADAFGDIILCSRFEEVQELMPGYKRAYFIYDTIPINSLGNTLLCLNNSIIEKKISDCTMVVARVPSIIAFRAVDCAKKLRKPYMVELMGDAWDGYWNHDLTGKFIAPYMFIKMKRIVRDSDYALYVTEKFLQNRYPCKRRSTNASNVVIGELNPQLLESRISKISLMDRKKISLMTSAGVDAHAKGHEFVICAMKELNRKGYTITYYLAGGGNQNRLRNIAKENGVEDQVVFLGELSMEKVYEYIDNVDIYIQPSLQEGLPRAVIEAMSRACPCLGSRTAGTPELLDTECIFERKSSIAIAEKIIWFLQQDLSKYATHNFQHAKEYTEEVLDRRRNAYFDYIKQELLNYHQGGEVNE